MLEIPFRAGVPSGMCGRLSEALDNISRRAVTHPVEERFLNCHRESELRELQRRPVELRQGLGWQVRGGNQVEVAPGGAQQLRFQVLT